MESTRLTTDAESATISPAIHHDPSPLSILSMQPQPTMVRVVHFRLFRWWITAIMRHWRPGESGPDGRCKLCRVCRAYGDGCLTVVNGKVGREEAALLSISDRVVQENA